VLPAWYGGRRELTRQRFAGVTPPPMEPEPVGGGVLAGVRSRKLALVRRQLLPPEGRGAGLEDCERAAREGRKQVLVITGLPPMRRGGVQHAQSWGAARYRDKCRARAAASALPWRLGCKHAGWWACAASPRV
jgi:hypothetical protein